MLRRTPIVQDHDAFHRDLRSWLETKFSHCPIVKAAGGEQAHEIIPDIPPQVILLNISLSHMNDVITTQQIMAIRKTRYIVPTRSRPEQRAHDQGGD